MSNYIFCIFLLTILFSCHQESIRTRTLSSCVNTQERTTSIYTGFDVFNKGFQENGYAQAIKINKPWEASISALLLKNRDVIDITFSTYFTEDAYPNNTSELIYIDFSYNNINSGCLKLVREFPEEHNCKFARASYYSTRGDIALDAYLVDEENDDSYLEIEEINLEEGKISGKFMITFLRRSPNTEYVANLPIVRFLNGYFEADLVILPENE